MASMDCVNPKQAVGFPDRRCGRCVGCLAWKSWLWTSRARLERHGCAAVFFVTLTWAKLPGDDGYEEVKKWLKRVRKVVASFRYLCTCEFGKARGRLHYHLLVYVDRRWVRSEYRKARDLWRLGYVHVRFAREKDFWYVCKYATKDGGRVRASNGFGSKKAEAFVASVMEKVVVDPRVVALKAAFPGCSVRFWPRGISRKFIAPVYLPPILKEGWNDFGGSWTNEEIDEELRLLDISDARKLARSKLPLRCHWGAPAANLLNGEGASQSLGGPDGNE